MSLNLCDSCCADCRHEREPNEIIVQCGAYKPPQSNADRIRSMSDEGLAKFQASRFNFTWKYIPESRWLDWLRQPAEE
jgi:hypothetical protein